MILTCPNCNGQFNIDDNLIGEKGRKVKCSSCAKVWFQEPEHLMPEEDTSIDNIEDNQDIDDNNNAQDDDFMFEVDLVSDDFPAEEQPDEEEKENNKDDDRISLEAIKRAVEIHDSKFNNKGKSKPLGYGLAACLFVLTFVYILLNSGSFMNKYPSMQALYGWFGIHLETPGKGLVFDGLIAEDNGEIITISGRIINLESDTAIVPMIEASLIDNSGQSFSQWYIQPPQDHLDGESDLSFHSVYYKSNEQGISVGDGHDNNHEDKKVTNIHKNDAGHVQIRFSLLSKTGAEDGENNFSHHQDDQNHQSDHVESSKSHQSSSSASHQEPSHVAH